MNRKTLLWIIGVIAVIFIAGAYYQKSAPLFAITSYPASSCSVTKEALFYGSTNNNYISWLNSLCYNVDRLSSSTDFSSINWDKYNIIIMNGLAQSATNLNKKPLLYLDTRRLDDLSWVTGTIYSMSIGSSANIYANKVQEHQILQGLSFPLNLGLSAEGIMINKMKGNNLVQYKSGTDYISLILAIDDGTTLYDGSIKIGRGVYYSTESLKLSETLFKNSVTWLAGTGGACTPNWQCGSWSSCLNGQQTRTCTDSNNCGIITGKPTESQTCVSNICNTNADINCDNIISRTELRDYGLKWINNQISRDELGTAIQAWSSG